MTVSWGSRLGTEFHRNHKVLLYPYIWSYSYHHYRKHVNSNWCSWRQATCGGGLARGQRCWLGDGQWASGAWGSAKPGGWCGAGSAMGTRTTTVAAAVGRRRDVGSRGGGGGLKFFLSVEGTVWRAGREGLDAGAKSSQTSVAARFCRLTNEYTASYIRWLTDECTRLSSSVQATFLGAGTKEYSLVIFLGTVECNITEECTLVSCSAPFF
jgi:hypothetical protein